MPGAPFIYGVSLLHCMTVSRAQDGAGLGAVWGEQTAVRMLHEAGFHEIDVCAVDGDFVNSYYLARRTEPSEIGCSPAPLNRSAAARARQS